MDTDTLIWIIVATVVALVLIALVAMALRKKRERDAELQRSHASELRHQATAAAPSVSDAQLRAEEADAQARLARTEAERAEQQAAAEKQRLAAEEAQREDLVREADRVDPDVDHRSTDYTPGSTAPATSDGVDATDDPGGTHRA